MSRRNKSKQPIVSFSQVNQLIRLESEVYYGESDGGKESVVFVEGADILDVCAFDAICEKIRNRKVFLERRLETAFGHFAIYPKWIQEFTRLFWVALTTDYCAHRRSIYVQAAMQLASECGYLESGKVTRLGVTWNPNAGSAQHGRYMFIRALSTLLQSPEFERLRLAQIDRIRNVEDSLRLSFDIAASKVKAVRVVVVELQLDPSISIGDDGKLSYTPDAADERVKKLLMIRSKFVKRIDDNDASFPGLLMWAHKLSVSESKGPIITAIIVYDAERSGSITGLVSKARAYLAKVGGGKARLHDCRYSVNKLKRHAVGTFNTDSLPDNFDVYRLISFLSKEDRFIQPIVDSGCRTFWRAVRGRAAFSVKTTASARGRRRALTGQQQREAEAAISALPTKAQFKDAANELAGTVNIESFDHWMVGSEINLESFRYPTAQIAFVRLRNASVAVDAMRADLRGVKPVLPLAPDASQGRSKFRPFRKGISEKRNMTDDLQAERSSNSEVSDVVPASMVADPGKHELLDEDPSASNPDNECADVTCAPMDGSADVPPVVHSEGELSASASTLRSGSAQRPLPKTSVFLAKPKRRAYTVVSANRRGS